MLSVEECGVLKVPPTGDRKVLLQNGGQFHFPEIIRIEGGGANMGDLRSKILRIIICMIAVSFFLTIKAC